MDEFDSIVGLDLIKCIHLNDSKGALGSRIDRHEHIGKGAIGVDGFALVLNDPRLADVPMILETPKSEDMHEDVENLAVLRSLVAG
jgi:deoxyribonuclease-4